jgi:hypothetical protein
LAGSIQTSSIRVHSFSYLTSCKYLGISRTGAPSSSEASRGMDMETVYLQKDAKPCCFAMIEYFCYCTHYVRTRHCAKTIGIVRRCACCLTRRRDSSTQILRPAPQHLTAKGIQEHQHESDGCRGHTSGCCRPGQRPMRFENVQGAIEGNKFHHHVSTFCLHHVAEKKLANRQQAYRINHYHHPHWCRHPHKLARAHV